MSESQYGVRIATNKSGNAYIAGLYGKDGVSQKLKAMGMERKEFLRYVKQAAIITAQRATHLAPKESGKLALSIRGFAGKKITPNNQPAKYLYGGVVVAQPNVPGKSTTYAKSVSFGRYYKSIAESTLARIGERKSLSVFSNLETRTMSGRTKGNPYIRTARDQTRQAVVKMYNKEIGQWIRKNGFETTGFGG
jgi:hypothetical protein